MKTIMALCGAVLTTLSPHSAVYGQCSLVYTFTGETANDLFGQSVAGAGDVNGDGFADVIIGAPGSDVGGDRTGQVYVYSGIDGSTLYTFTGTQARDCLGLSVSGAGDVNNDGFADIIVGAPQAWGAANPEVGPGYAYVYSGLDGSVLYALIGEATGDHFGRSVSSAGDVNNDGYADLIVGAQGYDAGGGNFTGRAYVFYGGSGPFPATIAAGTANSIFTGYSAYSTFGFAVACAGDINADGHDDVFVGAGTYGTSIGEAYVYSGADDGLLYSLISESSYTDLFGFSVAGGSDLNNDGIPDLIVGARRYSGGGSEQGRVYAFYGHGQLGSFPITIGAANADLCFTGEAAGDNFGSSVSGSDDVNGDGHDDIIVGAPLNAAGGTWAGRAYLYSGRDGALLETFTGDENDQLGVSVSRADDINNDGIADLVVGARSERISEAGKAYVYAGFGSMTTRHASFDIKPQSCPNPLNVKDKGGNGDYGDGKFGHNSGGNGDPRESKAVLPAAVMGTEVCGATEIDPATIRLLETIAPVRWSYEDVGAPADKADDACACSTEGPDGFIDLTLKFDKAAVVAALGEVEDGQVIELTLTGELYDGTPIEGSDCVEIHAPKRPVTDPRREGRLPTRFALHQNYPNPFNPATDIAFALPEACDVTLEVFNLLGQRVVTLVDGYLAAGEHRVTWDASRHASGVYYYRLTAGDAIATKRMMLLK